MKNIILKLNEGTPQFLGMSSKGEPIVIEKTKSLSKNEWDSIKEKKWNKYLIEKGILTIEKKKSKIERDIEEGKIELNEGME